MPRKKPFSGKQKKLQLKEKKKDRNYGEDGSDDSGEDKRIKKREKSKKVYESDHVTEQAGKASKPYNPDRYRLQFLNESNSELKRRKELGHHAIHQVPEIELEISEDLDTGYIDIAKRPPWDYSLSTDELEKRETKYFEDYVDKIFEEYQLSELSYFELNLETWRQLWRVLEMSDIALLIVDIRFPMHHFSPALYNHVTKDLGKHIILVLNKVDIVAPELVVAWKQYFLTKYPKLQVATFTSYPKEAITNSTSTGNKKRRRGGRFTTNLGAKELLEICESIVQNNVDLSSWRQQIETGKEATELNDAASPEVGDTAPGLPSVKFKNGILTIGCIGYPNVGKSSLLNGLKGMKVVSVSKTPGHTKHFQTIFLTPTVRLCDCPGLVFPSKVDKALQVIAGIYPISQLREPFSAIRYLAERVNIPQLLHLKYIDPDVKEWTPYDICEAWALRRGLITAKAGRPDIHRSANQILRMGLDSKLCVALRPPGFTKNRDMWKDHQDTKILKENLSKYQPKEEEDEGSDELELEDFEDEKDEDEVETSESEEEEEYTETTTQNPFALLADD